MSTVNADNFNDAAGTGAPDFPNGLTSEGLPIGGGGGSTLISLTGGGTITYTGRPLGPILDNGVTVFAGQSMGSTGWNAADKMAQKFLATGNNIFQASSDRMAVNQPSGNETNTLRGYIYSDTGTEPDSIIATSTNTIFSHNLDTYVSATDTYTETIFYFSEEALTIATTYWFVVAYETFDVTSENFQWAAGNSNPYDGSEIYFDFHFDTNWHLFNGGGQGLHLATVQALGADPFITFTEDMYISVPGMLDDRNTIPVSASPISCNDDELVVVTYNSVDPAAPANIDGTISKTLPDAFVETTDQFILLKSINDDLYLGNRLDKMLPGDIVIGRPSTADDILTFIGSTDETDNAPAYSSVVDIAAGDPLAVAVGKIDAAVSTLRTLANVPFGNAIKLVGDFTTGPGTANIQQMSDDAGSGTFESFADVNERSYASNIASVSGELDQTNFGCNLFKFGSPVAQVGMRIHTVVATNYLNPVFTLLHTSNNTVDTTTLTGSSVFYPFTFTGTVNLVAGTHYAFEIYYASTTTVNGSNMIRPSKWGPGAQGQTNAPYSWGAWHHDGSSYKNYLDSSGTQTGFFDVPATRLNIIAPATDVTNAVDTFVHVPGLPPERNLITAGTTTLKAGEIAYVPLNKTGTASDDRRGSIVIANYADYIPAFDSDDKILFRHRVYENDVDID